MLDGRHNRDVFVVEILLGSAIMALSKCFIGNMEGTNVLATTRMGPGSDWWLSVFLERRVVGGQ